MNLRRTFIALVCVLGTTLFGMQASAQNGRIILNNEENSIQCEQVTQQGFQATFVFNDLESQTITNAKGDFSLITMPGTIASGLDGTPSLPMVHKMIAMPIGATATVKVLNYTVSEYYLNDYGINTLMPQQPSVRKDQKPEDIAFVYDLKAYQSDKYSYRPLAEVQSEGVMRGLQVGSLCVNPVSYNAAKGTIKVYNNIEIEVSFNGANAEAQELFDKTWNPYFETIYQNLFNYRTDVYTQHPDLWNAPVNMIVIADRFFEATLQPWLEWKTQKGFYLDVNYTDVIGNTASSIKTFLQNKYNTGVSAGSVPTFVVLVGDVANIPASATGTATQTSTDLYYGSIDNDIYPDMFYSRMSAETKAELYNIITKTLAYEKYTMTDPSYLNNALLIAGADSYWNPIVGQPAVNYATTHYFNTANNFTNVYSYLNSYNNCYANLNTGVGFANYTAHGDTQEWYSPNLTNSDLAALTNTEKYFWAIGNCCLTGNYGANIPCFGEAMIRSTNAAFAYIGSAPVTYWYDDYYFGVGATNTMSATPSLSGSSTGCIDGIFDPNTYNTVSSAMFVGNLAVSYADAGNYSTHSTPTYYWQAYHVFGDGSVMPYVRQPIANTVSHMNTFPIGVGTFTINADAGSYAAISKDGVLLGTALIDSSGSAQVQLTPVTTSGNVSIVVTCPQRQPYIAYIPAITLDGPYISIINTTPNKVAFNSSINVDLDIANIGNDTLIGNTSYTFTCNNANASIVTNNNSLGTINNGDTTTINNAFTLTVNNNVSNNEVIVVQATATNDTNTYSGNINFTVMKPEVVFESCSEIGNYEVGDTISFTVKFNNTGSYAASNTFITASTTQSNVSFVNDSVNIGSFDENTNAIALFELVIGQGCPLDTPFDVNFDLNADNGITAHASKTIYNSCNITLHLHDNYGDGWNGCYLTVSFSYGPEPQQYTIENGSNQNYNIDAPQGAVATVHFTVGDYASECSFSMTYDNGYEIANQPTGLTTTTIKTFTVNCAAENVEYAINIDENIVGGTIQTSVQSAHKGDLIILTNNPDEGYIFLKYVLYNESLSDSLTFTSATFTMPEHDVFLSARFQSIDGIDESELVQVSLFPNPSNGLVKILAQDIKNISISNLQGQIIFKTETCGDEYEMDLSAYSNGVYFINIETENGSVTKRLNLVK